MGGIRSEGEFSGRRIVDYDSAPLGLNEQLAAPANHGIPQPCHPADSRSYSMRY